MYQEYNTLESYVEFNTLYRMELTEDLTLARTSTDAQTVVSLAANLHIRSQLKQEKETVFENLEKGKNIKIDKPYISSNFVEVIASHYVVKETFDLDIRDYALEKALYKGVVDPWSKYETLPRDEDFEIVRHFLESASYPTYVKLFKRIG